MECEHLTGYCNGHLCKLDNMLLSIMTACPRKDIFDDIQDRGYNTCDMCGSVEIELLHWLDSEEFWDNPTAVELVEGTESREPIIAVCCECFDQYVKYIAPIPATAKIPTLKG